MKFLVNYALSAVVLVNSASGILAESDQTVLSDLPTNRNVVEFANRAEASMLSELREDAPVAEGYFQRFVPDEKLGYVLDSDRYVLGRLMWNNGPTIEDLLNYQGMTGGNNAEKSASDQQLLDGLVDILTPDWKELSPERYEFSFVGRAFLGTVHCLVYDVKPLSSEDNGFKGRVYFEDQLWNIVRFTGMSANVDRMFAALRGKNSKFHIDSWRVNVAKNRWVPAYAYVEEVPPLNAPGMPVSKGQIRFWGYGRTGGRERQEFIQLVLNESPSTEEGGKPQWPSPQQSQRLFETQAEHNVLARLLQAEFLGAPGEVEKKLDQVVTNLVASNKLVLGEPVHCRILLTTPLEAFIVGNTIVISRGLIDSAPSESALALVMAHQLAHYVLGHRRVDTGLAFADVLKITDAELLAELRFRHSESEEEAADKRAVEIVEQSPYNRGGDSMSDAGLFMQALRFRATHLPALIRPNFGEHVADVEHVVRNNRIFRTSPVLDEKIPGQVAALPLGSRLVVDPWDGRVELFQADAVLAPTTRERAELSVTPIMPFMQYVADKTNVLKPKSAASRQRTRGNGSAATHVVQIGQKETSAGK